MLRYQRYDWVETAMGAWVEVAMPDVVVVDGAYTLRPQLRVLFDVTVSVEASEEVRLRRQVERGQNPDARIRRWAAAEDLHVAESAPRSVADVMIEAP